MRINEGEDLSGSGNAFSRSFLVGNSFDSKKTKILNVFDDARNAREYSLIRGYASGMTAPSILCDETGLWEFVAATEGEFATTYGIFEAGKVTAHYAKKHAVRLRVGDMLDERTFVTRLVDFGFDFAEHSEDPFTYRRDGDTVTVRIPSGRFTISFFDGTVESVGFWPQSGEPLEKRSTAAFGDRRKTEPLAILPEKIDTGCLDNGSGGCVVVFHDPDFSKHFGELRKAVPKSVVLRGIPQGGSKNLGVSDADFSTESELRSALSDKKSRFFFHTKRPESLSALIAETHAAGRVAFFEPPKSVRLESFVTSEGENLEYRLCDDVLSPLFAKDRAGRSVAERMDLLLKIASGDYVVHRDHGVGIFHGIEKKTVGRVEKEFVRVEYAGGDVLFVPLSEIYRIGKYVGDDSPTLHKLGGNEWKKSVERAEADVEKVAAELLDIYAKRKLAFREPNKAFPKEESAFKKAFPYSHTADQSRAIDEILADMAATTPMDRLLSGDVGFWKTEVAMNAAYRSALGGRQTAFVSPLVVLAYEHFESLTKRFEPYGLKVAVLTRFSKESEERAILKGLKDGSIDIVVGTHRLLSGDVRFKNLGLLVVDEEHRFGVLDKEKITAFRENVDILSLSATPIPRSLNLSLSGVRGVSLITTPPPRKKPIATSVSKWDPDTLRGAISFELERGGQVIVLHNRVKSLGKAEEEIRRACAGIRKEPLRIVTVHGQMAGTELEDRIVEFKHGDFNILLSTTVVENGVNFLRANTIIIDEADEFGLASLHQLRGRVGRKDVQAFCHLLYRKDSLQDDAKKRLVAIASNSHLGAGFEISMRDLEIRGAGEILGLKQSGRTKETGLPLYFKLLEEKVAELKAGKKRAPDTKIDLDIDYGVPDSFFDSEIDKLHFFRSLESVKNEEELDEAFEGFSERVQKLPAIVENLFLLVRSRIRLTALKVASLKKSGNSYVFEFIPGTSVPDLRKFLELDTEGKMIFIGGGKVRAESGPKADDVDFLRKLIYSA